MPRGSVPKREAKKPKKKAQKREVYASPIVAEDTVEVVGKRRRRKAEATSRLLAHMDMQDGQDWRLTRSVHRISLFCPECFQQRG